VSLGLTLAVLLAAAPDGPADAPLDRILAALRKPKTVAARFEQTKTHPAFSKPQVSRGHVFLARPARLDFTYETPHQVRIQLEGTTLRLRYGRSGRTRTLDLADDPKMGLVFDTLRFFVDADRARLEARYVVTVDGPTLELVPKDAGLKKMVQRIRARADLDTGVLSEVELLQSDGSRTTLRFLDPKIDGPAPEAP